MHFLLLGASGRTGHHVLSTLLAQHHTATALVRSSSSLAPHAGLTIIQGSPLDKSDIKAALLSTPTLPSAAIFTLNAVRKSDSPFAAQISPPRFLADSCANLCDVLKEAGVQRVVVMSTAGAGDSWGNLPLLSKAFMGLTNVKYALRDHDMLDREIRETGMEWTLVRAVRLVFDESGGESGEKKEEKGKELRTLGSKGEGMGVSDSVGVESVGRFLVKVAVEGLYVREAVVVAD